MYTIVCILDTGVDMNSKKSTDEKLRRLQHFAIDARRVRSGSKEIFYNMYFSEYTSDMTWLISPSFTITEIYFFKCFFIQVVDVKRLGEKTHEAIAKCMLIVTVLFSVSLFWNN